MGFGFGSRSGLARKSAPARRVGWKGSHRCSRVASELWIELSLGFGAQKRARYRGWLAFQLESRRWMYSEPDMQPAGCPARRMRSMSYLLRVWDFCPGGTWVRRGPRIGAPFRLISFSRTYIDDSDVSRRMTERKGAPMWSFLIEAGAFDFFVQRVFSYRGGFPIGVPYRDVLRRK